MNLMILLKKLSIVASLDVDSLFANIPLEESFKNCVNDFFSNNFYSGKLSRKDWYELLKLVTTESSFIFDNKLYKQIDEVAMDSPLGPTLANAFLYHYEKNWLNVLLSLNLWTIFLFCLNLKNIWSLLSITWIRSIVI